MKGSVGVNVRFQLQTPQFEEKKDSNQPISAGTLTAKLRTLPTFYEDSTLKEIKILYAGIAFGELALIENKPRAATIICKEDCGFAVLDKKNFDLILS